MGFANVQTSGQLRTNSAANLSWTPGGAPTLNNLLTCRSWSFNVAYASGDIQDSSGTPKNFTLDVQETGGGGDTGHSVIASLLVPSGLTTPLLDVNGSGDRSVIFDEWSGNDTTNILDQTNVNGGNGTTGSSGTVNTSSNCGLALAVTENTNGTLVSSTGGADWNQDSTDSGNTVRGAEDWRTNNVASQIGLSESWSWSGTHTFNGCIATYNSPAILPPGLGPVVQMQQEFHFDSALMR